MKTGTLLKETGIDRETLYRLIRHGFLVPPVKVRGRYQWDDSFVGKIRDALAREREQSELVGFAIDDKRYLGSKSKTAKFLRDVADAFLPEAEVVIDLFAGTGGAVSQFTDKTLILNDMLYTAAVYLEAFFSPEQVDLERLETMIERLNGLDSYEENYVSDNFSNTYFSYHNARKIGQIRLEIERAYKAREVTGRERAALICALLHGMDGVANVYAHYDTYKKQMPPDDTLLLEMPRISNENNLGNRILCTDANMLAPFFVADIALVDPPMDSRQYGDIYHLPENIARWEQPSVEGVSLKSVKEYPRSLYCRKEALDAYHQLIEELRVSLIIAAYPNKESTRGSRSRAKIDRSEMLAILQERGPVHIVFPPLNKKVDYGRQLLLSYEFIGKYQNKKLKPNLDGGVMVCECTKPPQQYTASPLNYPGSKAKVLKELLPYFPKEIDTFYDVFAGGCSVGINANAKRVVFWDNDAHVIHLLEAMDTYGHQLFLAEVLRLVEAYELSLTLKHGYRHYGVTGAEGLAEVNRIPYTRFREAFNAKEEKNLTYYAMLYILIAYGYHNMVRFNSVGEYNLPVGKRDFNVRMASKLKDFCCGLERKETSFVARDFRMLKLDELGPNDFVYFDPPYFGGGAFYNEQQAWDENDERDLIILLDQLDMQGVRFALSGVLSVDEWKNAVLYSFLARDPGAFRIISNKTDEMESVLILNY